MLVHGERWQLGKILFVEHRAKLLDIICIVNMKTHELRAHPYDDFGDRLWALRAKNQIYVAMATKYTKSFDPLEGVAPFDGHRFVEKQCAILRLFDRFIYALVTERNQRIAVPIFPSAEGEAADVALCAVLHCWVVHP